MLSRDLMEELVPLLREAVDRKQENMRRRRRRDALRLNLNKMLLLIAQKNTFSSSPFALEGGSLHPALAEYLEGVRLSLEGEGEKDAPAAREQRLTFADFVTELIKSFPLEMYNSLLKKELVRSLFSLFGAWCGPLVPRLGALAPQPPPPDADERLTLAALRAMSALVCCGPCFAPAALAEDGSLYPWLDEMLSSTNDKCFCWTATPTSGHCWTGASTSVTRARRASPTAASWRSPPSSVPGQCSSLLSSLSNPDIGPLLDWCVDKCYTGAPRVADGCFIALATIFSARSVLLSTLVTDQSATSRY
ncbi:Protein furry-like protein-like [Operophtera brumata]|uniref:Protein furry-like protein-like n=1 Tax=Operophtera brumata TaxID=104452 RepID=A0A0L7LB48_OPEBR|nr:Protein furry-like protein-like [Operophtera brumata]